jgi:hypothetical protein
MAGPRYKFGIRIPRNLKEAMELDKESGTTHWQDALRDEIGTLLDFKTFRILPKGEVAFEGMEKYTYVPLHFVFDVKFDLRRKVRCVAGGNWTAPPDSDVFSGVVSIDNVRIALFAAVLNGLWMCAADVGSAFLHGYTRERVYTKAGPEWGPLAGCLMIVERSIYGLKTSAAAFHEVLAKSLLRLGFVPSRADSDLWIKDCDSHYEYICTYVDDLLVMSKDPMAIIRELQKEYPLKGVGQPEYYLGGDVKAYQRSDGTMGVSTSAKTYIKRISEKVESLLGWKLKNYGSPMDPEYHPELDTSSLLQPDDASKYRMLIGSLNWTVTLGRFDVYYVTQTLARYGMAPRQGHLDALRRAFGYLKHHSRMRIEYDTRLPEHAGYEGKAYDWFEHYGECEEELPPGMPTPKGNPVRITAFFDADHAGCLATRRSTTGMLMFLNNTPIKWYSKRQATVESATYGSEMVAGRITVEFVIEMRYKLRMLGIPIIGSCVLFGDNASMITSATIPSSSLKKKHNAIGYHRIREAVAARIVDLVHCGSTVNVADLLTKALGPQVYSRLLSSMRFPIIVSNTTHEGECQGFSESDGTGAELGVRDWNMTHSEKCGNVQEARPDQ